MNRELEKLREKNIALKQENERLKNLKELLDNHAAKIKKIKDEAKR